MPITFKVASHDANEYTRYGEKREINPTEALNQVWHLQDSKVKGELTTKFTGQSLCQ
jgi:hypothetical protein